MALTNTQLLAITDNISQDLSDFNAAFITNTGVNTPLYSTIVNGVASTGATSGLIGRLLAVAGAPDLSDSLTLLPAANKTAGLTSAYITSLRSLSSYYASFYPILDALDLAQGGLNLFLSTNSLQVNGYFAQAFNAYAALAVALGYRGSANVPTPLVAANYFPYSAVDSMWGFTASGATTFSANAVGTNASTLAFGSGVGQVYIYKNNATNAIGGATFTISYTNASGSTVTATYATTSGVPLASGSLAAGYAVTGCIASAITGVTGTGMTSGEQYTLGIKLVRATSY